MPDFLQNRISNSVLKFYCVYQRIYKVSDCQVVYAFTIKPGGQTISLTAINQSNQLANKTITYKK